MYDGIMHCTAKQAEGKRMVIMDAPASCGGTNAEEFAPDELDSLGGSSSAKRIYTADAYVLELASI